MFLSILIFISTLGICVFDGWKKRISRPWWTIYFGLCGMAGCVVTFLVFVSEHEATSPNALIVWLNPLQLITALTVWWQRTRTLALIMNWYNLISVGLLLLVWPFQPQSANPAFFPLMASAVALGATYTIISFKKSSNIGKRKEPTRPKRKTPRQKSPRRPK